MKRHFSLLLQLFVCVLMRHHMGYRLTARQKRDILNALYTLWVDFFSEYTLNGDKMGKTWLEVPALGYVRISGKAILEDQDPVHEVLQELAVRAPVSDVSARVLSSGPQAEPGAPQEHGDSF